MRVGAVVAAAGASVRLGGRKQLMLLGEENLLERAVKAAREAGCDPVVVVLGAWAEEVLAGSNLAGAVVVVNADWEEGMGSSIAAGAAALAEEVEGVIVMTCDQPGVSAAHLQALTASGTVTGSGYGGRCGVPAFFPAECFEELMDLRGEEGARGLLRGARVVALRDGELDVDTVEDLRRARQRFGQDRAR